MSEFWVPVKKHLKVEPAWAGLSGFDAVRRAFPEVAPRDVWRLARQGKLLRNGDKCHPMDRLTTGDVLTVVLMRPRHPAKSTPTRQQEPVETTAGPFWVVREDDSLLAVSKPAGCASHPAARHRGDTLIERVREYLGVGAGDRFQPALANRLDIDTSGLTLIAKTRAAQRNLGRHLQLGKLRKWYLTLVGDWPEPHDGEVKVPLVRRPDSRDLARLGPAHSRCRERMQAAHTRYRTLERLDQVLRTALLEVEIVTGRTHQIRRHLTQLGHPLAGDRRYGDPVLNREVQQLCGVSRMFLHAHRVRLQHPGTGEDLVLDAPLPEELTTVLKTLGCNGPSGDLDEFPADG